MYKYSTNHFICHFCWLLAKNQDTWMNFLRMSKQPPWQRQKTSYFSKNHREQVRSISGGLRSLRIMQILNRCLEMKVNIYKNITIIMVCAYVKFLIRIGTKQKKKKKNSKMEEGLELELLKNIFISFLHTNEQHTFKIKRCFPNSC